MDWFDSLTTLKGISPVLSRKFSKLGIHCVGDLLLHFPSRYEDHTRLTPLRCLRVDQYALIEGRLCAVEQKGRQKKRALLTLTEGGGRCELVFFHTFPSQWAHWQVGNVLRCFGQVKAGTRGFQMSHPEWRYIPEGEEAPLPAHLTPIYPTVAGLSQKILRKTIQQALRQYQADNPLGMREALEVIHAPSPEIDPVRLAQKEHTAYHCLMVEELLAHHFVREKIRQDNQAQTAYAITIEDKTLQALLDTFPFMLTPDQQQAWETIRQDLRQNRPMLRLLQGEVGCGKTIVAALAAYAAVQAGQQVAIMVPTEILAEQHYAHFQAWFLPFSIRCGLLTGKLKTKERRQVEENIALGLTQIIIGTHALFQDTLQYKTLGLIVIDEQHRFGVDQRLALREKGAPHQLMMTATPIPRTLAMTQCAHLDISTISTLPPGRQPIHTVVIPESRRAEMIERIRGVCQKKEQVYWVCTLIAESDVLQCQAAEVTFEALQMQLSPHTVGLVHGKLDPTEKGDVMERFHRGEIDVLVATTVIEVGVNVPNATLMVIENAERLGLAQLHQIRGRVGRGRASSFCVLLYQPPLSEMAKARLATLKQSQDGFVIAEADLALRGPGEIIGVRQTGTLSFRVLDLQRDREIVERLPEWLEQVKTLSVIQIESMIRRWLGRSDYVTV